MLLSQVVAQGGEQGDGAGLLGFLLPVALLVVFWVVLIRPQRKRQRELAETQRSVEVGQQVMTSAGLIGTVVRLEDDEVLLEIAPGVEARFVRRAIANTLDSADAAPSVDGESDAATSSDASEEAAGDSLPVTHDDGRKKDN